LTLVNVDPENPANTAPATTIRDAGFGGVRIVSRNGLADFVTECHEAGLFVLACVNEQSHGYLVPGADLYQIGNEPDIAGTNDSMPAQDYAGYAQLYRNTYRELPMITAGLASGQPLYLRDVDIAGGLVGFNAIALHYPKDATDINRFTKYAHGLPKVITEWWRPADHILEYKLELRKANVMLDAWFCWGYGQWALQPDQLRALRA